MRSLPKVYAIALLGAVSGWGCAGCTSNPNGALSVVVLVPTGATANVTVAGPGGYSQALTQSTVLTVPAGAYTVTAARTSSAVPALPVSYAATVSGSPATVAASAAAQITVSYSAVPGTGNMWLGAIDSFTGDAGVFGYSFQSSEPGPTLLLPPGSCPSTLALDTQGSLWVVDACLLQILKYSPAQLSGAFGGAPAATLANNYDGGVKDDGGFNLGAVGGLAFDSQGALWVTDLSDDVIVKYANATAFSGFVVTEPTAILANNLDAGETTADGGTNFLSPVAIAFDSTGNLWLGSSFLTTAVKYSGTNAMTGLVAPDPDVVLSDVQDGGALAFFLPFSMAFDSQQNLWLANGLSNSVVKLNASQLTVSGEVQPVGVITDAGGAMISPTGLAFDQAGNLWLTDVVDSANGIGAALEFTSGSLATLSGTQDVDAGWVTLYFSPQNFSGIALDPPPTNLPLPQQH